MAGVNSDLAMSAVILMGTVVAYSSHLREMYKQVGAEDMDVEVGPGSNML